jgi:small subunit ribosomal protein S8
MVLTDPIADMLTRIRNAGRARHATVDVPSSKMKMKIAEFLKKEGFLNGVESVSDADQKKILRLSLRYRNPRQPMLSHISRVSRPGCRVYATVEEVSSWKNPIVTLLLSTSKGLLTNHQAKEANLGGEVILKVQ